MITGRVLLTRDKEEVRIVKRRIFIIAIMGSLLFCLSGCQHKKSENYNIMLNSKSDVLPIYAENDKEISNKTSDLASLEDVDAGYNVEEWKCENEPNGIICLEDSIMISDKASDAIIQMDYSGNLIKKIGKTGNGEGEFLSPGAIKEYNHEIYVLDQGNNRVQILSVIKRKADGRSLKRLPVLSCIGPKRQNPSVNLQPLRPIWSG